MIMKLFNAFCALACAGYAAYSDSVLAMTWAIWFLVLTLAIDIEDRVIEKLKDRLP